MAQVSARPAANTAIRSDLQVTYANLSRCLGTFDRLPGDLMRGLRRGSVAALLLCLVTAAPALAIDTSGSVTTPNGSFVKYPDGGVVRIAKVERLLSHSLCEFGRNQACIWVGVTFKNTGTKMINFALDGASLDLYYGVNEYSPGPNGGLWANGPAKLNISFPQRCAPGTTVRVSDAWAIPKSGLKHLAVKFETYVGEGELTPYTFTNVQTLVKNVP